MGPVLLGIDLFLLGVGAIVLIPCAYLLALALFSARLSPPEYGPPRLRFDFVVPAHNEALGIARTVENLLAVDYPPALRRVLVVADNCSDQTAARARDAGATVLERHDSQRRGKGYALAYAFEQILSGESPPDAVVVVDADTIVSSALLHAFAARLERGAVAVQAHYGVSNATASWRTRLMTIAFALFHGVRSLARERFRVSAGLRGNGMCFRASVLREVPHDAFSVVEDVEYGIRLARAGHRVHYAHEVEVLGEMVSGEEGSRSQRRRWEGGRAQLVRQYGASLLLDGLKRRSALLLDLAMDVLVPPLSMLVGAVVLGLSCAAALSLSQGAPALSLHLWGFSCVALALYVGRGWWLSGMGARGLLDLMWAPVYMIWKLTMIWKTPPPRGEWVRTTREAESKTPKGAP